MKRSGAAFLAASVFVLVAAVSGPAFAEPPENDDLVNAEDLGTATDQASFGTNIQASAEAGEPAHAGQAAATSVWHKWTAPADLGMTFDTCHPSNYDTRLAVYAGPAAGPTFATLTPLASNDDGCDTGSRVKIAATSSTTYYIALDSVGGGCCTYSLRLRSSPVNDDFSGTVLSGVPVTTTGNNAGATKEPGEPNHGGDEGGASVWWSWTAPAADTFTIETCGSDFDTLLAVYTGGGFTGGVTLVDEDDDTCGSQSRVTFLASAGTTYRIAVDGKLQFGTDPSIGAIKLDIAQGAVVVPDTTEPSTSITSFEKKRRKATIEFTGSDDRPSGVTYECKLDNGAFEPCTSPATYRKLKPKRHTIQVRAVDAAGNADSTPASQTFRIKR